MSKRVTIEVHGSLCDFLPGRPNFTPADQSFKATYAFYHRSNAKEAVESLGIPHVEIDQLLLNDEPASFDQEIQDGFRLTAYPLAHPCANRATSLVKLDPPDPMRFLVDENSGKLASSLLLLGFDTKFDRTLDDPALAETSARERRVLLTRDIGLLKRSVVRHGYWLRSDNPRVQLSEVIGRYGLWQMTSPFSRCLNCNWLLAKAEKNRIRNLVPDSTFKAFDEFFQCSQCEKIYWKGSHFDRMSRWLEGLEREFQP